MLAASYGYDAVGNLQTMHYANGVTNLYQYDRLNRLTNQVWKAGSTAVASFAYALGATGNRTNLTDNFNGTTRSYAWTYDPLYRLTNENISVSGNVAYGYDVVGNRTNRGSTISGLTNQVYTFNTNDWLNIDSYDANGNTIGSGGNTYQYDALNRLTNVNNSIFITYDGDGNRVSKKVGTTTTFYLLDDRNPSGFVQSRSEKWEPDCGGAFACTLRWIVPYSPRWGCAEQSASRTTKIPHRCPIPIFQTDSQVLEEWTVTSSATNLAKVYNYGSDLISQRVPSISTNYFIFDGHGSTRALTDNAGTVKNVFTYDAYGTLIASNTTAQTFYLYSGQQFDPDLGQYYLRARTYNQGTGRFWTMDTDEGDQEDPLSLHKYLYCEADPVGGCDPSGHAVYFVTRKLSVAYGWLAYNIGNSGHGYLLFTAENDPGTEGNPLTHGYSALTTFSWHPNSWNYASEPADAGSYNFKATTPGRVWEGHPDDMSPSSYQTYLISHDKTQQKDLLKSIHNWINSQPVGYERGNPVKDPNDPGNTISSSSDRRPAPDNGVYYNLTEQNCVWWATIMLVQNGIALPQGAHDAIMGYNHGIGGASAVLSGQRSASILHRQSEFPPGMSLPGGFDISPSEIGLGDFF